AEAAAVQRRRGGRRQDRQEVHPRERRDRARLPRRRREGQGQREDDGQGAQGSEEGERKDGAVRDAQGRRQGGVGAAAEQLPEEVEEGGTTEDTEDTEKKQKKRVGVGVGVGVGAGPPSYSYSCSYSYSLPLLSSSSSVSSVSSVVNFSSHSEQPLHRVPL